MPGFLRWILHVDLSFLEATLIAGAVAGVVGLILSPPLMRLTGSQAAIATLAVLVIIQVVLVQTDSVTRGRSTMLGVPESTTMVSALVWAIITIAVAYVYQCSKHGMRLRAARDDERAARSLAIRVPFERGVAFVLSAFLAGAGGSLYCHFITTFTPDVFYFSLTFLSVTMLVVGGLRSLSGAVIGVVFLTGVSEFLRQVENNGLGPIPGGKLTGMTDLAVAGVLVATLILRPEGLTGGNEISWPHWRRHSRRGRAPVGELAAGADEEKDRPALGAES
jgi:branched-chain amino acid transport system permease protein